ncbi:AAA family ATPase, partial [[Eubacterium] hominis]
VPQNCNSYEQYITSIYEKVKSDLIDYYNIKVRKTDDSLSTLFYATKDNFIFIMDEWDSIFYKKFMTDENKKEYLEFLRGLLKSKTYVELAYMTGVLPIAKYSSGSELNMFDELNFMNDDEYDL